MASLEEAFPTFPSWEEEYKSMKRYEAQEKENVRAEQFMATFGIPFSELRRKYTSGVITNDGTTHYIHATTGERYGYVYAFGTPHWKKEGNGGKRGRGCPCS